MVCMSQYEKQRPDPCDDQQEFSMTDRQGPMWVVRESRGKRLGEIPRRRRHKESSTPAMRPPRLPRRIGRGQCGLLGNQKEATGRDANAKTAKEIQYSNKLTDPPPRQETQGSTRVTGRSSWRKSHKDTKRKTSKRKQFHRSEPFPLLVLSVMIHSRVGILKLQLDFADFLPPSLCTDSAIRP